MSPLLCLTFFSSLTQTENYSNANQREYPPNDDGPPILQVLEAVEPVRGDIGYGRYQDYCHSNRDISEILRKGHHGKSPFIYKKTIRDFSKFFLYFFYIKGSDLLPHFCF